MSLTRVTAPAGIPISLQEARAQCRLTHDDGSHEDAVLMDAVRSATDMVEGMTGLKLLAQTWSWAVDGFPYTPAGYLRMPLAPTMSIASITYLDTVGLEQTLAPSNYRLVGSGSMQPARLTLAADSSAQWPSTWSGLGGATITFDCGWPDHNGVPEAIRQAIRMLVALWFDTRAAAEPGPIVNVPYSVTELLAPYRVWAV